MSAQNQSDERLHIAPNIIDDFQNEMPSLRPYHVDKIGNENLCGHKSHWRRPCLCTFYTIILQIQ